MSEHREIEKEIEVEVIASDSGSQQDYDYDEYKDDDGASLYEKQVHPEKRDRRDSRPGPSFPGATPGAEFVPASRTASCAPSRATATAADKPTTTATAETESEFEFDYGPDGPSPSELEADAAQAGWRRIYDPASPDGFYYPEGGARGWLVVFGAFLSVLAGFGLTNIIGTFQAYISTHQLARYSESTVSWIFSIYIFVLFFCGLQIGPIFDRYGPRWLLLVGCVCIVASMELIGLCTQYWHFVLCFSILGGLGSSFIFTPSFAAISHWFSVKRGTATGIAATGGSLGGVIFPLALQRMFPEIGFAWSTRILGFIFLGLTVVGNTLVRSRLPPKRGGSVLPDLRIFFDGTGALALTTAGVWLIEWGLFIPVTYLTSYALASGVNPTFSYQLIAIFNAGSCFGRWLPGYVADSFGRFNTIITTVSMCIVSAFAFWLPAGHNIPLLVIFAVSFGFASGTGISLTPICVGQLCGTQEYGRYYATCYTIVSFGCLTGIPIAGAILNASGGKYWGVILFTGLCYAAAVLCFAAVRVRKVGWAWNAVF